MMMIGAAFAVGMLFGGVMTADVSGGEAQRLTSTGGLEDCRQYRYINPDYACGKRSTVRKTSYSAFVSQLEEMLAAERASGALQVAGIHFRDLRGGPVWGISESINFAPASLLKLPLVMAYLSLAESTPGLMEREMVFDAARLARYDKLQQSERAASELQAGQRYKLEELARRAIIYSDNVAYYLLVDYINVDVPDGTAFVTRTFQELGVIDPRSIREETVTARIYAALFRLLYNVSYLNAESSERLLGWLVEARFGKGLIAGLPSGTVVANKYGERELPDGTAHLHDCGIVYFPGNPYLLCVMTKGKSWDELGRIIATVSGRVWKELESRRQ
ncbi:MAG TPA: serine hydrolase [Burkholderiales bacterium]|nr:serine hydrolase [Burkholderiales bacterium]